MTTEETTPPAVVLSTALLDAAAQKRDRQTTEPGGCECHHCGCIFIGGPEHTACAECHAAFTAAMHEDYRRAEHQAEMRHVRHECRVKRRKEVTMACEHCVDPDGVCCFPMYGVGPHKHVGVTTESGSWIGSTMELPKTDWPANYAEDPDCPGLGTWWCPHCGDGKPFNA